MKKSNKAFTLVELIVVIIILAILGTIWFLSFQSYNVFARDTVRTSDLSLISRWIKIKQVEWGWAPKPENFVTLTASGTEIWYQWEFTSKIWNRYWLNWEFKDPLDWQNYVYSVDSNLNTFTIWWFLESDEVANNTDFLDSSYALEWRILKTFWDKFWIILKDWIAVNATTDFSDLTENKLNILDSALTSNYELFLDDNESLTWTGLVAINPKESCKRILELWNKKRKNWWNWVYTINPNWEEFEVYCDMKTNWGGWTMIWKNFWWPWATGNISNKNLWDSINEDIVIPVTWKLWRLASEKNSKAWEYFKDKKWHELIKLINRSNNWDDYTNSNLTNIDYINLGLWENVVFWDIFKNDNFSSTWCIELNNQILMYNENNYYWKTDNLLSWEKEYYSLWLANKHNWDGCWLNENNLVDWWWARHLFSYVHSDEHSFWRNENFIRCQFQCWTWNENYKTEVVWWIR